jgi:two-component system, cell cycle sensor histidine kinase and response regulator CckA
MLLFCLVSHVLRLNPKSLAAPMDGDTAAPTALVLDDEASLRDIMCRILRRSGFTVIAVGNRAEALAVLEDPATPVDILVTDLGLPTCFGAEVARAADAARPGLPVLYVSGMAKADAVRRELLGPEARLLQKPFRREALTEAVRAALAGEPESDPPYPGG